MKKKHTETNSKSQSLKKKVSGISTGETETRKSQRFSSLSL